MVTQDDLQNVPKWGKADEWPPLSPKKAIRAAKVAIKGLVVGVEDWSPEKVLLRRVGSSENWVYVIEMFSVFPPGVTVGRSQSIEVVVLLDGSAIRPKVLP